MNKLNTSMIIEKNVIYSLYAPYNPVIKYPEYPFNNRGDNQIYDILRQSFILLQLDNNNYGTNKWNPLGCIIKPNDKVVLKPNFIKEINNCNNSIITDGSVIRAIIDYVYIALKGNGEIIVCDGPQSDSDINKIKKSTGINEIQELYWNKFKFEIKFIDLRKEYWNEQKGIIIDRTILEGDPKGYIKYDLGNRSNLNDKKNLQYYGAFYDIDETNKHHQLNKHEYLISKTPIKADVLINIPKLKTHKKVGVTLNLKNLVGINGNKNWLPHYTFNANNNGDQYPQITNKNILENVAVKIAKSDLLNRHSYMRMFSKYLKKYGYLIFGNNKKVIRSGNWYGNDTTWRMCLDLNKIMFFGDLNGNIGDNYCNRKYLSVVDGIIGMEGAGPMEGTPKYCGMIAVGFDPLTVDLVCTKLMGFDYKKIKLLDNALRSNIFHTNTNNYNDIKVISNDLRYNKYLIDIKPEDTFHFEPHFGWKNHIEL
jgi:uncharacterized protein (DUF362 family)